MPELTTANRLATLFHDHFDLVWRTVRRLGVPPAAVDDAAQEVFVIVSRKLDVIEPGKERAFLYGIAMRVASDARRAQHRRGKPAEIELEILVDGAPSPEDLLDRKRARAQLDAVIASMPDDVRGVFVLYELESLTMAEIAVALDLAPGTVASRLRRAREVFSSLVARIAAGTGSRHG
ncbi:MAG: sigma-70 family RNA polymerase sigma factor [Kofleriaceae bacterium]